MKIGDRVFVSGYIDEIRKDTVIVRNDGGYSGSVKSTALHLYPVCSECGCEHPVANYCPNCGADMRGEQE